MLLAVLAVPASAGCGLGSDAADDDAAALAAAVVKDGPKGYARSDASGSLDLDEAAVSVGAARATMRRRLEETGFQGGYARVWEDGKAFATIAVYDFLNEARATEMSSAIVEAYDALLTAHRFDVGELAATGIVVNARTGEDSVFCQLVVFSRDTRTFVVRTCDSAPRPPAGAIALAARQQEFVDVDEK